MKRPASVVVCLALIFSVGLARAQSLPTAKPEQVGLSTERLGRIGQALKAQITNGRFPGAVALVARKGRIAYFESFGQRDPAAGDHMPKDAIFRLYSMTKPFTSVAAMILVEDRKSTRLNSSHVSISYAVFCLKKKKKTLAIRYT